MSNRTISSLNTGRLLASRTWRAKAAKLIRSSGLLLFTLGLFLLLVKLGFWQLSRAGEKAELLARAQQPGITVTGRIAGDFRLLLDNRTWQGQAGYQLLVPVQIQSQDQDQDQAGAQPWLLVNLGWLPQGYDRSRLPDIPLPGGERQWSGQLKAPSHSLVLGESEAPQGNRWRIQRLELEQISDWLGHAVQPQVLLLTPGAEPELPRDWRPGGISVAKHQGYAVQWFALAATWLVLCGLYWRSSRREQHQQQEPAQASTTEKSRRAQ